MSARLALLGCAAVGGVLLCVPAVAEAPAPTRLALFGRTLEFVLPAGMVRVTDRTNGTNALVEFVPRGETTANWSRMVTVQAYRGLGRSPAPTEAIARQAFYPAACRSGPLYRFGGERVLVGGARRALVSNGCASLPAGAYPQALAGAGEQDFIVVLRDAETIWTVNYAVRGAPFAGKAPPIAVERGEAVVAQALGNPRLLP